MLTVKAPKELLAQLMQTNEEPEEGYYPATWWGEQWGLSTSRTAHYLNKAIDDGKMEVKKFSIRKRDKTYPTPHYKQT